MRQGAGGQANMAYVFSSAAQGAPPAVLSMPDVQLDAAGWILPPAPIAPPSPAYPAFLQPPWPAFKVVCLRRSTWPHSVVNVLHPLHLPPLSGVASLLRTKGVELGLGGVASHLVGRIPSFSIQPNLLSDLLQVQCCRLPAWAWCSTRVYLTQPGHFVGPGCTSHNRGMV